MAVYSEGGYFVRRRYKKWRYPGVPIPRRLQLIYR